MLAILCVLTIHAAKEPFPCVHAADPTDMN
jgi:hypothetical protein